MLALYRTLRTTERGDPRRADALLLLGGSAVYATTIALVGQAHPYVWLPAGFFLTLLAALGLHRPPASSATRVDRVAPLAIMLPTLLALFLLAPTSFKAQLKGKPPAHWRDERPREIAAFLKEHLRPGDRVQLLDWFGGASGAAWRAQADSGARFYMDYQFHLHPSDPQSRRLQDEFFAQMAQSPPRFVIQVTKERNEFQQTTPADADAERAFNKRLAAEVLSRYRAAKEGAGYVVWELGAQGP
jgi:hypothetical protein